ncbi:MAG: hypothetical protein L6V35_03835 [Alistipes putredinis]|nr:MAG: hypothetical protein L6V35_03835 [Alistipes putredinis]
MYLSIPEDVDIAVTGTLDDFKADVLAQSADLSTDVSQNTDIRTLDLQKEPSAQASSNSPAHRVCRLWPHSVTFRGI